MGPFTILSHIGIATKLIPTSDRRCFFMKTHTHWVTHWTDTPLGPMTLAASPQGLTGAWFEGQKHHPDTQHWLVAPHHPVLQQATAQIQAYFGGQRRNFDLPLDLAHGTVFQQSVWQALRSIPCGTTCTYGELAQRLGKPNASRAVGGAVGRNPISILVPCHRVIGTDGSMTGYAGGLARKQALLTLERTV